MSMRSREDMQVSYQGKSRRTRGQPVLPGTKLTKAIDHPADKYSEYREQEERHDDRAISRSWLGQYLGSQLVIYSHPEPLGRISKVLSQHPDFGTSPER